MGRASVLVVTPVSFFVVMARPGHVLRDRNMNFMVF